MAGAGLTVRQNATGPDIVLAVTGTPYVRVTVGTTGAQEDIAHFRDPAWADKVARAIYQGIAAIYGVRNPSGI